MVFWIVLAAVVVVGFALAWWPGGHLPGQARRRDSAQVQGDAMRKHGSAGGGGGTGIPGGTGF